MEPLSARTEGGLLWLTLDTPGSDVNVFDLRAANALEHALTHLAPDVGAVVLTSTKPGSFVNGVGLMMAGAVKSPGDVARLTAPVRSAYRALRECPVPTLAAIHGNCFGCGVELALQCRHRIAVDDGPTSFYMTEIADYLFVPCFGATQDLPRVVGLDAAIRLVVDGERWTARQAAAGGLVDRVVPARGRDEAIRAMALEVLSGRMRSQRVVGFDPEAAPRARTRAALLPETQRAVAERAIDLLERGALGRNAYEDEIVAAEESVARAESKAAQGFFFVRQIAAARERRAAARPSSLVIAGLPVLGDLLARSAPVDLPVVLAPASRIDPSRLLLAASEGPGVDVIVSTHASPPPRTSRARAWAPFLALGARFVEIDGGIRPEVGASLALALARAGIETVTTLPTDVFASERVVAALIDPIERHLTGGGTLVDAHAALTRFGIARPLPAIAHTIGRLLTPSEAGVPSGVSLDLAIAGSLVAVAVALLAGETVRHPAGLDVIARHAIDFPLAQRSLTSFATVARARALLARASDIAVLTDPWVLDALEAHARGGRDVWS